MCCESSARRFWLYIGTMLITYQAFLAWLDVLFTNVFSHPTLSYEDMLLLFFGISRPPLAPPPLPMSKSVLTLDAPLQSLVWSYLITHEKPWAPNTHWGCCGQSCGCCRAANCEDWPSGCLVCLDAWTLTCIARVSHPSISKCAKSLYGLQSARASRQRDMVFTE